MAKRFWQTEKQGRNLRRPQYGLRLRLLPSSNSQRLSPKPGASAREEESGHGITGRLSRPVKPPLFGRMCVGSALYFSRQCFFMPAFCMKRGCAAEPLLSGRMRTGGVLFFDLREPALCTKKVRAAAWRLSRPAEPSLLGLLWLFGRHAPPLSVYSLRGERKRGGLAGHALCLRPSLRRPLPSGYPKREGARHD